MKDLVFERIGLSGTGLAIGDGTKRKVGINFSLSARQTGGWTVCYQKQKAMTILSARNVAQISSAHPPPLRCLSRTSARL